MSAPEPRPPPELPAARPPGAPTSLPLATLMAHVADAVAAVRAGRSLTEALAATPAVARPGTQALAFEVLRQLGVALALRERLVPKPPPAWADALLLSALALAQSKPGGVAKSGTDRAPRYASHTLVDQTVQAARRRAPAQAGFINAVLRRWTRESSSLLDAALADPVAAQNHPRWWADRLAQDWPGQAAALMAANQIHAPMFLRVNRRKLSVDVYLDRLAEAGIAAHAVPLAGPVARAVPGLPVGHQAIVLERPCPVTALPGFAEGWVSVQDLSAQSAAPLLLGARPLPPGARVLDACAAPGGKTAHLLELADVDLLALDADPQRLVKVSESLARLGLAARVEAGDAGDPQAWWDGHAFDAILLDAPCTASGIVRRHPDVRWLRRPGDVAALAATQARLLDALWPLLAPGGRLLYASCSVFKAEGRDQIDAFLQRTSTADLRPSPGHLLPRPDNPQANPGEGVEARGDGFFYALLHKRPS